MINQLHRLLHDPAKGWDPVPGEWAELYAQKEWAEYDPQIISLISRYCGNLAGLQVLDLGGGPGQFSVNFAKLGACVTWFDISQHYRAITERHATESRVQLEYQMGYFEDLAKLPRDHFDLIFNRVCWYYCINDAHFARLIVQRLKQGGLVYIDALVGFEAGSSTQRRLRHLLNCSLGYKIGHIRPPRGRIEQLFRSLGGEILYSDYTIEEHDLLIARKCR